MNDKITTAHGATVGVDLDKQFSHLAILHEGVWYVPVHLIQSRAEQEERVLPEAVQYLQNVAADAVPFLSHNFPKTSALLKDAVAQVVTALTQQAGAATVTVSVGKLSEPFTLPEITQQAAPATDPIMDMLCDPTHGAPDLYARLVRFFRAELPLVQQQGKVTEWVEATTNTAAYEAEKFGYRARQAAPEAPANQPLTNEQIVEITRPFWNEKIRWFDVVGLYRFLEKRVARQETSRTSAELPDLLPPLAIHTDRDMLNYLMVAFNNEIGTCERCGHSEPTKNMDSASFLRDYLKVAPAPAAQQAGAAVKTGCKNCDGIGECPMCGNAATTASASVIGGQRWSKEGKMMESWLATAPSRDAAQPASITFAHEVGGPWRLELNGVTISRHRKRADLEKAIADLRAALAQQGAAQASLPAWAASAFREIAASAASNGNAYIKLLAEDAIAQQGASHASNAGEDTERDIMIWLSDDPEMYANGPDDFANDYAANFLSVGDDVTVDVDCAHRLPKRALRITLAPKGDDDDCEVLWKWVDRAAIAASAEQEKNS